MVIKNKKAWIRVVESIVALLIISGAVLILLDQRYIGQNDISNSIYRIENSILREVQLNNSLRGEILESTTPVDWNDTAFSLNIKNKIISRTPSHMDCKAKICSLEENCVLPGSFGINVYAQSVVIISNLEQYEPRQLKLFCWMGVPPEIEEPGIFCGDGVCNGDETCATCESDCGVCAQTCEEAGGTCQANSCDTYSDCTSLEGSCPSGYCCSGTCTVPVPTCAELGGTDCCTGTEICEGTNLGTASDCSTICCQGTCVLPRAILTLVFSNTVYSLENGNEYTYTHTRTFTESNGVGVTLTQAQICFLDGTCDTAGAVNYRINANSVLVHNYKIFWTTYNPDSFTLKYWGIDDNDYDVYVEQSMCVKKSQFTENCVV